MKEAEASVLVVGAVEVPAKDPEIGDIENWTCQSLMEPILMDGF